MTEKEFRRLSRRELVDIIFELQKREAALQEELARTRTQLQTREIKLAQAGSIADAALCLHDIFARAQQAADQYVEQVARQAREERDRIIAEAEQEAWLRQFQ